MQEIERLKLFSYNFWMIEKDKAGLIPISKPAEFFDISRVGWKLFLAFLTFPLITCFISVYNEYIWLIFCRKKISEVTLTTRSNMVFICQHSARSVLVVIHTEFLFGNTQFKMFYWKFMNIFMSGFIFYLFVICLVQVWRQPTYWP